jgi:hypothetical protein
MNEDGSADLEDEFRQCRFVSVLRDVLNGTLSPALSLLLLCHCNAVVLL